ncbi:MAG: hypothetical protein RLY86_3467, partial [Pseudomonadota bacterium]
WRRKRPQGLDFEGIFRVITLKPPNLIHPFNRILHLPAPREGQRLTPPDASHVGVSHVGVSRPLARANDTQKTEPIRLDVSVPTKMAWRWTAKVTASESNTRQTGHPWTDHLPDTLPRKGSGPVHTPDGARRRGRVQGTRGTGDIVPAGMATGVGNGDIAGTGRHGHPGDTHDPNGRIPGFILLPVGRKALKKQEKQGTAPIRQGRSRRSPCHRSNDGVTKAPGPRFRPGIGMSLFHPAPAVTGRWPTWTGAWHPKRGSPYRSAKGFAQRGFLCPQVVV